MKLIVVLTEELHPPSILTSGTRPVQEVKLRLLMPGPFPAFSFPSIFVVEHFSPSLGSAISLFFSVSQPSLCLSADIFSPLRVCISLCPVAVLYLSCINCCSHFLTNISTVYLLYYVLSTYMFWLISIIYFIYSIKISTL